MSGTILAILLSALNVAGTDTLTFDLETYTDTLNAYSPYATMTTLQPASKIVFYNPGGKELVLDFSGDTLRTSGDLPLDEAGRMFATYAHHYIRLMECGDVRGTLFVTGGPMWYRIIGEITASGDTAIYDSAAWDELDWSRR